MIKSITKNSLYLLSSQAIEKVLLFAIAVLLSRYLGVVDFGIYAFSLAFAELFAFFFGFGLYELILREISRGERQTGGFLSSALTAQVVLSGLGGIAAFAAIRLMAYPSRTETCVYLALIAAALNYLALSFRAVLIAQERMQYEGGLTILMRGMALAGFVVCVFLRWHLLAVMGVVLGVSVMNLFLSSSIALSGTVKPIRSSLDRPDSGTISWVLRESLPFALLALFVTTYFQIDTVMLSKMKGDEAVGLYNVAYRLVLVLMFVSTSISLAVLPSVGRAYVNRREEAVALYRKTIRTLLALAVPIALLVTILAWYIIDMIYGQEYQKSTLILQIIVWVLPAMFLTNFIGRVLGIIHRQRITMSVAGVGALANVGLNAVLIPRYSYLGAAVATILTEFIVLFLQLRCASKYLLRGALLNNMRHQA